MADGVDDVIHANVDVITGPGSTGAFQRAGLFRRLRGPPVAGPGAVVAIGGVDDDAPVAFALVAGIISAPRLGFCEHFERGDDNPLPPAWGWRILDGVIRLLPVLPAEKTGGSRPRTRDWPHRIEPSSPNGRPRWIDQRDRASRSPGSQLRGTSSGAHGALHPGIPIQGIQGGIPVPWTESRRWQPEASRRPRSPFPWRSGYELRCPFTLRLGYSLTPTLPSPLRHSC